jgi:hypothetical protein
MRSWYGRKGGKAHFVRVDCWGNEGMRINSLVAMYEKGAIMLRPWRLGAGGRSGQADILANA